MDLKLKDVAELLNVSETTIRRWLVDGKIPGYRLNHQYRFSRSEIENWMIRSKLKPLEEGFSSFGETQIYPPLVGSQDHLAVKGGMQHFALYRAIHQGEVFIHVSGSTKEEIIRRVTCAIGPKLGVDGEMLSELLLDREKLMPTALNNGIAVPHTREFLLKGPLDSIVMVFPEHPIEYGALDGFPVHTLFFLFASSDKMHLHLLAKLAHLCSQELFLNLLAQQASKKEILEYIRRWEASLRYA